MMDINSIGLDMALRKLDEVAAQRDELLTALQNVVRWDDMNTGYEPSISGFHRAIDEAKTAIAKFEEQS